MHGYAQHHQRIVLFGPLQRGSQVPRNVETIPLSCGNSLLAAVPSVHASPGRCEIAHERSPDQPQTQDADRTCVFGNIQVHAT